MRLRSRFSAWCGPQSRKVALQLQDLPLLFGGDGTQRLTLKISKLRLKFEYALCRVIPALLERAGDQTMLGIYSLIATFCQGGFVAGPLDPPLPPSTNRPITFFEVGQCFEGELDRQRCDSGNDAIGNIIASSSDFEPTVMQACAKASLSRSNSSKTVRTLLHFLIRVESNLVTLKHITNRQRESQLTFACLIELTAMEARTNDV
jgi:hypothetical protein